MELAAARLALMVGYTHAGTVEYLFMEDTQEEVNRKIKKAFCPEKQLSVTEGDTVLKNGCMEYVQYLVLPKLGSFEITFKGGGSKSYTNYDDVREDFLSGAIHPSDLKPALAAAVNVMLEPVRQSLKRDEPIEWVRVHDLPDFTYFSHRAHVNNGVGCESCHGRVDEMPITSQEKPLTMQWCLSCHRNPEPNLRPADKITAMGYDPANDSIPGHELLERYAIRKDNLTECVTCHR